jgi:hypothetical protein
MFYEYYADEEVYDIPEPDDFEYVEIGIRPGPKLVAIGSILVCTLLAFFLYSITAEFVYPGESLNSAEAVPVSSKDDGNPSAGNVELDESKNTSLSNLNCQVSNLYPPKIIQWCDLITHYANKHGLSPNLVAALIWQESGGNPIAYSRSGAVGLMQVMPRDGLAASFMCQSGPCFKNRPTIEELKDPEFNISYGTRMLAGLISRYGNLREGLKYYGPMDVGYYYADKVLSIFQRHGG